MTNKEFANKIFYATVYLIVISITQHLFNAESAGLNLVGDIGEALAHEAYGLVLEGRSSEGIDGVAPDGRPAPN